MACSVSYNIFYEMLNVLSLTVCLKGYTVCVCQNDVNFSKNSLDKPPKV